MRRLSWLTSPVAIVVIPGVVVFGLLYLIPTVVRINGYNLGLATLALVFVVAGLGWNVMGGLVGQISFGHAVFFGFGAYVTAWCLDRGLPFLVALAAGGAVAAGYGALWGYPTLRLRGPYFAIATIGVGEATRVALLNWSSFTGGASGRPVPVGTTDRLIDFQYALLLAVVAYATHALVQRSKFGAGLSAIRGDIDAAGDVGVNASRYQLAALLVSAFLVGLAGGFYARIQLFVTPNDVFGFQLSVALILVALIGGVGTLWGPVIGAGVYIVLQQTLQTRFTRASIGIYGVLVILIILFEPLGLAGLASRLARLLGLGRVARADALEVASSAAVETGLSDVEEA